MLRGGGWGSVTSHELEECQLRRWMQHSLSVCCVGSFHGPPSARSSPMTCALCEHATRCTIPQRRTPRDIASSHTSLWAHRVAAVTVAGCSVLRACGRHTSHWSHAKSAKHMHAPSVHVPRPLHWFGASCWHESAILHAGHRCSSPLGPSGTYPTKKWTEWDMSSMASPLMSLHVAVYGPSGMS